MTYSRVTQVCSLYYKPPELLLGQKVYAVPLDIWSLGCTFAEMVLRKPLLKGDSEIGQLFKIFQFTGTPTTSDWEGLEQLENFKKSFPKFRTPDYKLLLPEFEPLELDLLLRMLTLDPKKRPSAADLLLHQYFNPCNNS